MANHKQRRHRFLRKIGWVSSNKTHPDRANITRDTESSQEKTQPARAEFGGAAVIKTEVRRAMV